MRITAIKKVLPFLISHQVKLGYAPTNREIAKRFGYTSAYSGNLLLAELEKDGYIRIARTKAGRAKSRIIDILKIK